MEIVYIVYEWDWEEKLIRSEHFPEYDNEQMAMKAIKEYDDYKPYIILETIRNIVELQ